MIILICYLFYDYYYIYYVMYVEEQYMPLSREGRERDGFGFNILLSFLLLIH